MPTVYLRFRDLKARGIVTNWTTLTNWIKREGFPARSHAWLQYQGMAGR